ncbi:hypothetical protein LTR62_005091 [Meristemomyces frigidus]|uniref:F-box domain-containing protein n=1 Tax=Meristemomyces frigidus TaxID=1508187 RepID=A0AAN7TPS8_9PEZI|nr:hypothetical protein LTR62_005091 [Meristemomyces frigidus]
MTSWSEGEAMSSDEDFYATGTPDASIAQNTLPASPAAAGSMAQNDTPEEHARITGDTEEDSSSEMDMSVSSQPSSSGTSREATMLDEPAPTEPSVSGTKRKLSDATNARDTLEQALQEDSTKKPRLSSAQSKAATEVCPADKLPTELWQQVFLRLTPAILCRLLSVSKKFNHILTGIVDQVAAPKKKLQKASTVRVIDSDTIFKEARQKFMPNMPRPPFDLTELDMLKLLGGKDCQFCGRLPLSVPATSPFNAGPGHTGVRVIWPFAVRTCGPCWDANTIKDVALLVTPNAGLRSGLPHAFQTPDLHFIPETQRQSSVGIPSQLHAAKVYCQLDVQRIAAEVTDIRSFGAGAYEGWKHGLADKGKAKMVESARWERWELLIRHPQDMRRVLGEFDPASFPQYMAGLQGRSTAVSSAQPLAFPNGTHTLPLPLHNRLGGSGPPMLPPGAIIPNSLKPVKNHRENEEARAVRKTEIERRCMDLQPPLRPSVLEHIDAYRAALQISISMDDTQWETLKPRLLAQRESAELAAHDKAMQLAALNSDYHVMPPSEYSIQPAKDLYGPEYERAQEPLRKRLGEYADEVIHGPLQSRQCPNGDDCREFAIEVMVHVQKRYEEDKAAGKLPAPPQLDTTTIQDPKFSRPLREPFLSLDNMKWMYENKVRCRSDLHWREEFLCRGCMESEPPLYKFYTFESLIQHTGAKHNHYWSKANIVVHWQTAEWPGLPPFHPNPWKWVKPGADLTGLYRQHRGERILVDSQVARQRQMETLQETVSTPQTPMDSRYSQDLRNYTPRRALSGAQSPSSYRGQQALPTHATTGTFHDLKLKELSSHARSVWDSLNNINGLLDCVRVQTVIYHICERFLVSFQHGPSLDIVIEALASNPLLRPIKEASGLACQICVRKQTNGGAEQQKYFARIKNVRLFNFGSLATHFKQEHCPVEEIGQPRFSSDMIEWPDLAAISALMQANGMDDRKLGIIAEAFPSAFPMPLPPIGSVGAVAVAATHAVGSELTKRLLARMEKKEPKKGKKKRGGQQQHGQKKDSDGTPQRSSSRDSMPEAGVDEYDPRKPSMAAAVGGEDEEDPMAKFDTDVAKKKNGGVSGNGIANRTGFELNAETLAALSALTSGQQVPLEERSPSVGRAEPDYAGHGRLGASNGTAANGEPDVSAILASLTAHLPRSQAQKGTPLPATTRTPALSSKVSSSWDPYRSAPTPAVVREATPEAYRTQQDRRMPSYMSEAVCQQHPPVAVASPARYEPYGAQMSGVRQSSQVAVASPVRYEAYDSHATIARNASHYQQNQHIQYSHIKPTPVYQAAPRSPPRYRVVEEHEYAQAHPQYIQVPEHTHYPQQQPTYAYERPPQPRPVFLDEYGRQLELIPIDSAPAPVQYMPHPYELQQQQLQQQQLQQQQQQQAQYAQYAQQPQQYQPVYAPAPAPAPAFDTRPLYQQQAYSEARYEERGGGRGSVGRR